MSMNPLFQSFCLVFYYCILSSIKLTYSLLYKFKITNCKYSWLFKQKLYLYIYGIYISTYILYYSEVIVVCRYRYKELPLCKPRSFVEFTKNTSFLQTEIIFLFSQELLYLLLDIIVDTYYSKK